MINLNHEDPKSIYFIILLLQLLDTCVKALFFFTFLHQINKILKSCMKGIRISLGKVGKVTRISEEISVENLLHVLFLLSAHAMAYMELRKDPANLVGSDLGYKKAVQSQNSASLVSHTKVSVPLKMFYFILCSILEYSETHKKHWSLILLAVIPRKHSETELWSSQQQQMLAAYYIPLKISKPIKPLL